MSLMRGLVVTSLLALALADVDQPCDEALNESSKQTWRFSESLSTVPFSATAEKGTVLNDSLNRRVCLDDSFSASSHG